MILESLLCGYGGVQKVQTNSFQEALSHLQLLGDWTIPYSDRRPDKMLWERMEAKPVQCQGRLPVRNSTQLDL